MAMASSVGAMAASCNTSFVNVQAQVQCRGERSISISSSVSRVELSSTAAPSSSTFLGTGVGPSRSFQWQARELWSAKQTSPITALPRPSVIPVRAAAVTAEPPAAPAPSKQKIRIKLRSYWVHLIQQACLQILDAAKNTNAQTMGPVPLPTKKRIYCVLRSPHVDKDSREHFEIRTHYRLIDLANPNAQTIDALMQLDLPAGVDVEVKL